MDTKPYNNIDLFMLGKMYNTNLIKFHIGWVF